MHLDCSSISIIVVTSPSPSMPDTLLIDTAIDSISLIEGLKDCKIFIIMDGVNVCAEVRTKRGKITPEMVERYDQYYNALREKYFDRTHHEVIKLTEHHGFAYCVHHGLSLCNTKYALIMQHDRAFRVQFTRVTELIQCFETHSHIRYIGFTTSSNVTHDRLIATTCNLNVLNQEGNKLDLGGSLYLQPLIFWFDSNHLCHVQRYLEIYKPFTYLPKELQERVGVPSVKKMVMRKGDFIEDRFGQMQRICLTTLYKSEADDEFILKLFRWFGTYLCWQSESQFPYNPHYDRSKVSTTVMVQHLGGRQLNPTRSNQLRCQAARRNIEMAGEDADDDIDVEVADNFQDLADEEVSNTRELNFIEEV